MTERNELDRAGAEASERTRGLAAPVELWNVGPARPIVGGQRQFNIVGRLVDGVRADSLTYRLNGSPSQPVYVKRSGDRVMRLQQPGDFNIDTVSVADLNEVNELELTGLDQAGQRLRAVEQFKVASMDDGPSWDVRDRLPHPAARIGQVVDGRWTTGRDRHGDRVGVEPRDAGLDRIILFTPPVRCQSYVVDAEVCIHRWTRTLHNLGILFDWTGHRVGDGHDLPPEWTTGLAYYYSNSPGLRVRLGLDVRTGPGQVRHGDVVLGEQAFSPVRALIGRASQHLPGAPVVAQLPTGRLLRMRLEVSPSHYMLSVARAGRSPRHLKVKRTHPDYLAPGSCGIIAHYCAVRVHGFKVRCLDGSNAP